MIICDDIDKGIEQYAMDYGKRPRFLVLNKLGYLQIFHDMFGQLTNDVDSKLSLYNDCIIVVVPGFLNTYTFGGSEL